MIGPSDSNVGVESTDDANRSPRFSTTYTWGDSMTEYPHISHVRFYFQNCRIPTKDPARVTLYKDMYSLHADVIGFAETCLNSSNMDTRNQVYDDFQRMWHSHKITFSAAHERTKGRYQRGGTLQLTTGKLSSRVTSQGSDTMGRFCWQRLHMSNTKQITIITAYRVCQEQSESAGPTSAYWQQWRALTTMGQVKPNPRKTFLHDLGTFIDKQQAEGDEILLQLDANTVITNQAWTAFLERRHLVDLHGIISTDPFPNSHTSGTTKIDYILGTTACAVAVRKGGIRHFKQGPQSDHRGLYIDFDEVSLFSEKNGDPTRPAARQLRLSNTQSTKKYVEILLMQLEHHNVFARVAKLPDQALTLSAEHFERRYNAVDRDITASCRYAESQCTRQNVGFPFSIKLAKCGSQIVHLRKEIRRIHRGEKTRFHLVPAQVRHASSNQGPTQGVSTLAYLYEQIRIYEMQIKSIQADSIRHREECLTQLALNCPHATSIEAIKEQEKLQRSFRTLKRFIKRDIPTGLNKLEVHDYDDNGNIMSTKVLTSPESINTALFAQQYKQFGQAKDTPCVNSAISEIFSPFDISPEIANLILDGNFNLDTRVEEPMQAVHDFFAHLQRPHNSDGAEIDITITSDDFIAGFKKVQERTSSSASGRHMGHYKVAARYKRLASMYATMMDLPMKYKFAPERWQHAIQVLLEKDKGSPNIDRLRTIQLVEADLNMVLRIIFGRRLVHHAEDKGFLPKSQFGSRPGIACISAVVLKTVTLDLLRQCRQDACIFNLDATGCYDRIIPSIGMISCMRLGMPYEPAIALLKILHGMQYQIRTALGITEESFSNMVDWILGTLQGSGASPCIWLAISAILIAALEQRSPGITFRTPDGRTVESRAADAFVDDTDLYVSVDIPFSELATQAKMVAQHWEQLLYTSGGALNLKKCFWYGVTWEWIDGKPQMKPISQSPGEIQLTTGHGTTLHTIKRKEVWEGMRTLGVRLAPLGNFEDEHAYRLLQFRGLAQNIQSSPISRFDAYLGYVTMLQRMLRYPLGATSFTKAQCRALDASFMGPILSKMGFNRNTSRAIIFGPIDHGGGMGHGDTENMQGQEHLDIFLSHIRHQDQTGNVLRISLETLNLFLGLPKYPMTYDFEDVKKIYEPIWLTNTWEFLSSLDGHVLFTHDNTLKTQCKGDRFLMDDFLHIHGIGSAELHRLNQCRLYLQVTLLSEITSAGGKTITPNYIRGNRHARRRSRLLWPRQERPTDKAWKEWSKRLVQTYCDSQKGFHLRRPLAQWTNTNPQYQQWDDLLDPVSDTLYCRDSSTNAIHKHTRLAGVGLYSLRGTHTNIPPSTAIPAQILQTPNMLRLTAHRLQQPPLPPPKIHRSLGARLNHLSPSEQQLVGNHFTLPQCEADFIRDALNGKVHSGTDGSSNKLKASHSWVLKSSRTGDFMGSHAATHPKKQKLSSKRPEAAGHAAALIVTRELLKGQKPVNKTMRFHVDNMAVVRGSAPTHDRGARHTLIPEWDLMQKIALLKKELPIKTNTVWVKGHQDAPSGGRHIPIAKLSFAAQLNCHADASATAQYECRQCISSDNFHPPPEAQAYIVIAGQVITSHLSRVILSHCRRAELRETILAQTNWTPAMFNWVNWTSLGRAFRQVARHLRATTAKLQHNLLATAVHLHSHGNTKIDKRCFRCHNLREDFDHILWCPHGSLARPALWDKFIAVVDSLQTAQYIKHKLLFGISQWQHQGKDSAWPVDIPLYTDTVGRLTHIAYFEQEQLGWEQALRGRLSKRWGEAQDQYYKDRQHTEHLTGDIWMTRIIHALWEYSKAIWMERNAAYHGADDHETQLKQSDDLNDLIVRSYSLDRHHPAVLHTPLYQKPIEDILQQPDASRRAWLRSVDAALTGYCLRVPTDPTPRTSAQLWQGTIQSTRHRHLRDQTI